MMMFRRAFTAASSSSIMPAVIALRSTRSGGISLSVENRRIDSSGPSTASGGMIAFTREPSLRRASTMGVDSSTRRPTWLTILSMMRSRCASSRKADAGQFPVGPCAPRRPACACSPECREMVGSCSSGSSGPSPNTSSRTSSQICCFSMRAQQRGLVVDQRDQRLAHLAAHALVVDGGQRLQVDLVQQLAVQRELEFLVLRLERRLRAAGVAQQPLLPASSAASVCCP